MPLTLIGVGEIGTILKVKGTDKIQRFLESLGFIEGANIMIIAHNGGNLIVNIKDSRVAISQEMAHKIIVKGV
ncbi:MAG: FeoA family protein [Longibaculum sp.]